MKDQVILIDFMKCSMDIFNKIHVLLSLFSYLFVYECIFNIILC